MESGRKVVCLKPDFVRLYPAVVVKDTVLENWFRQGRFIPLTLGQAVEITKRLYCLFTENGICVIRMGLHGGDSLINPNTVVAGPFHPAFGHLVHSALFLDRAVTVLERHSGPHEHVTLKVHPRHLSRLKGNRGENLERLRDRFSIKTLMVVPDTSVPLGEVAVRETG
jgi:histone acetyltransferase (RNA polymerase elongator complex component)